MTLERKLNIKYGFVQAFAWTGYCAAIGFAAVFLQGRGYSNTELGLVAALGNVAGFVLSQPLASLVDRSKKITLFHVLWGLLALDGLLLGLLWLLPGRSAAVSVLYGLYVAVTMGINPLNNQMIHEFSLWGFRVDFGRARGMGSLAYVPASLLLGGLVERFGADILTALGLAAVLLQAATLLAVTGQRRESGASPAVSSPAARSTGSSIPAFLRENRRFCLLLLGMAFLYCSHGISENYLINVTRFVGGGTRDMGGINAYMAFVELPAMLLYSRLSRRVSCRRLTRFAAVFFAFKSLAIALSGSVLQLYAAHTLQGLSYAVLAPAIVEYVRLYVPNQDSAKGQSLAFGVIALGNTFASLLGGALFDRFPVPTVLMAGSAIAALGAVICFAGVVKKGTPPVNGTA